MASGAIVSGLDRLVEAVEATEAAARRADGFPCPHPGCARVFSKRYNQQAHMRIHDGTRPFRCLRCAKDFMWKSSLKSHAKMHDKMDMAAAAAAAVSSSSSASAPATGVAKRRSKTASPPARKLPRHHASRTRSPASSSHHPPPMTLHLPSPNARPVPASKARAGRQSPDCISRVDLETATLLTSFR